MQVPLASPDIVSEDKKAVMEVLETNILSLGSKLNEFETNFAQYTGARYGIGVNSGTSGLHLIVKSLGLHTGDEVITTPFSFIASSNALLYEGVKPVFVDIDPLTLNLDPGLVAERITEKTRGILGVHVFGHPYDIDAINSLAKTYQLHVIEDACEAIGAKYKGRMVGTNSAASVFAFYPNKQMTTGEGGMIITNQETINDLSKSLRNQGRNLSNEWLVHERLGYNYRLDEMSCALGISQLRRIDKFLEMRSRVAKKYTALLKDIPGVEVPYVSPDVEMSWFVYVIKFEHGIDRNEVMQKLSAKGIGSRPYFSPIHLQPLYADGFGYKKGDFPITEDIAARTLAIPFFNTITDEQIEYVVNAIKSLV